MIKHPQIILVVSERKKQKRLGRGNKDKKLSDIQRGTRNNEPSVVFSENNSCPQIGIIEINDHKIIAQIKK